MDNLREFIQLTTIGKGDSDRHAMVLFSIALAARGKVYVELGVRHGTTTLPILTAAHASGAKMVSVDIEDSSFVCPEEYANNWEFVKSDAIAFLESWDKSKKIDFLYIDDWHSYEHVKKELEIIDSLVGPSSVVILHDLMWGNHDPFYHCDLTLKT